LSKKDGKNTYTCKQFFNDQYTCGKDQITLIWLFFSHLKIKIIISLLQLTTYHVYCYHKTTTGFRVFINKQSTKVNIPGEERKFKSQSALQEHNMKHEKAKKWNFFNPNIVSVIKMNSQMIEECNELFIYFLNEKSKEILLLLPPVSWKSNNKEYFHL